MRNIFRIQKIKLQQQSNFKISQIKCFILFIFSLLSWRLAPAMRICRARICSCGRSPLDPRTEPSEAVGEVPPTASPPSLKVCLGGDVLPKQTPQASFAPGFSRPSECLQRLQN